MTVEKIGLLGLTVLISVTVTACSDEGTGSNNGRQDSGVESDADADADADSDSDADTDVDTETKTDTDVDSDMDAGTDSGADVDLDALLDTTFIFISGTENDAPVTLVEGTTLQLQFGPEGYLSAHAGCNSMSASFEIVDGILVVGDMVSTAMGCDPEKHAQDAWFADLLQASPSISVDGDTLITRSELEDGDNVELIFRDEEAATPDLALWDTPWRVKTLIEGEVAITGTWDPPAILEFEKDGNLTFFTGCNEGSATYEVTGNQLVIRDATWTEAGCSSSENQQLETFVLSILGVSENIVWEIDVDELILFGSGTGLILSAN